MPNAVHTPPSERTTVKQAHRRRHLLTWMQSRHGVAHTSDSRAAGFSGHDVSALVAAGDLRRVRRSWLVTPDCDPRRVAAASVGGRVTCLSAASLLGLWAPEHTETHVAVPGTASRLDSEGIRLHWRVGPAPSGRGDSVDPLLNVLFQVASCVPQADALAVWESAVRTKAIDLAVLKHVAWRGASARELAELAVALSDSGLETRFSLGMRRAGVGLRQQVWLDRHPVDGLIGRSLVVQLDGFAHHSSAADRRRDLEADARLIARGYVVLRFDYRQVMFRWEYVLETVLTAMAQGAHVRPVLEIR